jgi:precorrin-6B methylase 1
LQTSQAEGVEPFALGFAYEALARAEAVAGNRAQMEAYLERARKVCETMTDEDDRQQLLKDLETVRV